MPPKPLPPTIFKYQSIDQYSLLNLRNQQIYFNSPSSFNDPYDCALRAVVAYPTNADIIHVHQNASRYLPESLRSVDPIHSLPTKAIKDAFLAILINMLDDIRNKFLTSFGVACFCEQNDNLLMWSHYADSYKGFCLEVFTNNDVHQARSE